MTHHILNITFMFHINHYFDSAKHILLSSLRNTNTVSCSMPGRKEQNKRDLKKASANCYQLGIRKKINESKNSFSENQNRSTG